MTTPLPLKDEIQQIRKILDMATQDLLSDKQIDLDQLGARITDLTTRLTAEVSQIPGDERNAIVADLSGLVNSIKSLEKLYQTQELMEAKSANFDKIYGSGGDTKE